MVALVKRGTRAKAPREVCSCREDGRAKTWALTILKVVPGVRIVN